MLGVKEFYRSSPLVPIVTFFASAAFILGCLGCEMDLHIDEWGNPPGSPPPWQTDDIWSSPEPPKIGSQNKLFAHVGNVGNKEAVDVEVEFYYAPYGFGYHHDHFKFIDKGANPTSIGTGADANYEIGWTIDPNETNGGYWPYPAKDFTHFCVMVVVSGKNPNGDPESNTADNHAQNNFTNVTVSSGTRFLLLIANPDRKEKTKAVIGLDGVPKSMTVEITEVTKEKPAVPEGEKKERVAKGEREEAPPEETVGKDLLAEEGFVLEPDEIKVAACYVEVPDDFAFAPKGERIPVSVSLYVEGEKEPHSGISFNVVRGK